jgi:hypothetical protein
MLSSNLTRTEHRRRYRSIVRVYQDEARAAVRQAALIQGGAWSGSTIAKRPQHIRGARKGHEVGGDQDNGLTG